MIITISGTPGSGKSSVAKILAKDFGYDYISVGDFRRKKAKELGMSIDEYNKKGERDFSTDEDADNYQKSFVDKNNLVLDSRLGFHFLPNSYKILLIVSDKEATKRIFGRIRDNEKYKSPEETLMSLKKRQISDTLRYKKYYDVDCNDKKNFDLTIDTSKIPIETVVEKIKGFVYQKQ